MHDGWLPGLKIDGFIGCFCGFRALGFMGYIWIMENKMETTGFFVIT